LDVVHIVLRIIQMWTTSIQESDQLIAPTGGRSCNSHELTITCLPTVATNFCPNHVKSGRLNLQRFRQPPCYKLQEPSISAAAAPAVADPLILAYSA
jgi:hypothetical protein